MSRERRVALVTAAGRRIGRAITLELARMDIDVVVHYFSSDGDAEETAEFARELGVSAIPMRADLTRVNEIEGMMGEIGATFGRLDILVNNASTFFPTRLGATSEAEWDDLMDVNLKGAFFVSQLAAAMMQSSSEGTIINITDVSPERPMVDYLPYCAAKAGLISMTKGLARALAPRIRVNAIAPGPVLLPEHYNREQRQASIDRTLLGREGSPDDIAQAVRFLVDGPDYITGAILPVDGGRAITD